MEQIVEKIVGSLITVSVDNRKLFKSKSLPYYIGSIGQCFYYLESTKGAPYSITIRLNDVDARYEIGISIDGRNVVNGGRVGADIENSTAWPGSSYIFNVGEINGGVIKEWDENHDAKPLLFFEENSCDATDFKKATSIGTIALAVFREEKNSPLPRQCCACCGRYFPSEKVASEIFVIKYVSPETFQILKERP
jgi:hypothetical protein